MKIGEVKVKRRVSDIDYFAMVDQMVNIAFTHDPGNFDVFTEYRPDQLTIAAPSIVAKFCLDGLELEEGESFFDTDIREILNKDERIKEPLANAESGHYSYKTDDGWAFDECFGYADALKDATKIIKQRKKELEPAGEMMRSVATFFEALTAKMNSVDTEEVGNAIKAIAQYAPSLVETESPEK